MRRMVAIDGGALRARWTFCAVWALLCVLAVCAMAWSLVSAGTAKAASAEFGDVTPLIHGYPVILAAGAEGGVWYGGAINTYEGIYGYPAENVERVDYISPVGAFLDFGFPSALQGHYPRYFAVGPDGQEWFLADKNEEPTPLLAEVSPLGTITVVPIEVNPKSRISGLAMGSEGNLWTTETRLQGHTQISAILRVTPTGEVTAFSKGLRPGAAPANITAGPDGALWFTDTTGRIGRVDADGSIYEFPIGRRIFSGRPAFEPARPIIAGKDRDLWFIAGSDTVGRMNLSGHVRFFDPRSSYRGSEALGGAGELVGLASGPDGDIWFTRASGEVARMNGSGHVRTVTNRLANAYGIAFAADGSAWVGEGPHYIVREDVKEGDVPARLASITPSGQVMQYPPLPACPVPRLIGLDLAFAKARMEEPGAATCRERIRLGHVTIEHLRRHGPVIVVSQTPRSGTPTAGYLNVSVKVESVPVLSSGCRAPAFYPVLVRRPRLLVWRVTTGEPYRSTETYYGCLLPHGHVRVISRRGEESEGGSSVERLIAAGVFVGVSSSNGSKYGGGADLEVYDVSTGHVSFAITVDEYESEYSGNAGPERLPRLEKLGVPVGRGVKTFALKANGDIAWIGEVEGVSSQARQLVLYLHDRHGTRRVAIGREISGLAFRGSLLTWKSAGMAESIPG